MKNSNFCIALILSALMSFQLIGQETKHKYYIGANSKFDISFLFDDQENKSFSFEIDPQFGYFFWKNILLGIEIPLTYSQDIDSQKRERFYKSFTFSLFSRKCFGTSKVKPFIEGSAGFGKAYDKYYMSWLYYSVTDGYHEYDLFQFGGKGGISVYLNEKVSFNSMIGYNYVKFIDKDISFAENINKNKIDLKFGFSILF